MRNRRKIPNVVIALSTVAMLSLLIAAAPPRAIAQADGVRQATQDQQGDMVRDRILDRIENEQGLEDQDRERLRQHIAECQQLGFSDEVTALLFAEGEPLRNQIRIQARVLAMGHDGLPVEPVIQKLQEGRRKGAGNQVLEQVCARMESHVRAADHIMERAREDGIHSDTPGAERRHVQAVAGCMWSGLEEADMDQLRERARLRLRDGTCTTEDFAAAAETASRLHEMRIARGRAVDLAGEALQNGYSADEMQQLRWMVMTAKVHGGPQDEVLNTLERGLRSQHQMTQMIRQMQQYGWMGPADGQGGHGGMNQDNMGGGPGGGHHGDGDKRGSGGHVGNGNNGQSG